MRNRGQLTLELRRRKRLQRPPEHAEHEPLVQCRAFLATWLAGPQGTNWPLVAGYVMFGAAITMVSVWLAPETFKKNLFLTGASGEEQGEGETAAAR